MEKTNQTLIRISFNAFIKFLYCAFLLLLTPYFLDAQQNLGRQTILKFDLNNHVLQPKSNELKESLKMEVAKDNARFVGSVGGVSFDQIAIPDSGLQLYSAYLSYYKDMEDGHRLQLMLNDHIVYSYIPDWLLVPIAKYADSPFYSCVTIFGQLEDEHLARSVALNEGRVINYHPALFNTLLGVRLLYMDMLVGYNFTSNLPKNADNEYILGLGENKPNVAENRNNAYALSEHFNRVKEKEGLTFRSYVITDYTRKISFGVKSDSLFISGDPYYYCWRYKNDVDGYDLSKVEKKYGAELSQELANHPGEDRAYLISELLKLGVEYKKGYNFYTGGTFVSMVNMKNDIQRMFFLEQYATSSLKKMIYSTKALMDSYTVIDLMGFSEGVSSQPHLFKQANPEVWNATCATMRYAAFFRYIKEKFPSGWAAFIRQIKSVDPEPRIFSPTMMYPAVFEKHFNK